MPPRCTALRTGAAHGIVAPAASLCQLSAPAYLPAGRPHFDYGLGQQLDRLKKYGKPFWVTEFANCHTQKDGAQIDSVAKQKAQMTEMVSVCESRADVFRYAWFTGRWTNDPCFASLLGAPGTVNELGAHYLAQPFR